MNNSKTISPSPRLRFPSFTTVWEEKKLGEVCDSILVGFPFKGQDITDDTTGTPILRAYSIGEGIIRHGQDYDKYYPNDPAVLKKYAVKPSDIVISMDGSVGRNIAMVSDKEDGYLLIQRVARLRITKYPVQLIYQQIISQRFKDFAAGEKVGAVIAHISQKQIESFPVFVPQNVTEQNVISDCLSDLDTLISAQDKKVESLKLHKKGLLQQLFPLNGETTPRLRFTGFTGEWKEKTFSDLCNTVTPPLKLQSRDYLKEGKYPIVDQSQDLICGWTNDEKGVVSENPVIVFGDHTCVLKFIDFPFVQGADGVKIIKPRDGYCGQFVFQSFLANPVNPDGYKRHFSDLKEKSLMIPKTFSEQQIIAECLSTLDTIIAEETSKTEGLKVYKKGLMQQLFPNF